MRNYNLFFIFICGLLSTFSALGAWTIDTEESAVHFTSIKKNTVAEVHQFRAFSGSVENAKLLVNIDLASVDTSIDIRDQRMRDFLFQTKNFANATFMSELPTGTIASVQAGSSKRISIMGTLNLHGNKQTITTDVQVSKLTDSHMVVSTIKPIIINATDFGLTDGIMKLQQLAGLPSISHTVPVTFTISLNQE